MSRVSAKRMLLVAAATVALAVLVAFGFAALSGSDSLLTRLLGIRVLELGVPLMAGLVVGLGTWALVDDALPIAEISPHAEVACPTCGRAIHEDWRLCPYCGSFVVLPEGQSPAALGGRS